MTDQRPDLDDTGVSAAIGDTVEMPTQRASGVPAGWYPDPWIPDHHRYWTGEAWSGHAFPSGPASFAEFGGGWEQPAESLASSPDPEGWSPTREVSRRWDWLPTGKGLAVLTLVISLIVGFGIAFALSAPPRSASSTLPSVPPTFPAGPNTTAPPAPADPAASILPGLVIRQSDLTAGATAQVIPGGDQVSGETTIDLCNGSYPSESMRTARLQVAAADAQGNVTVSTEAVLYKDAAATAQGFAELRANAASCPTTPVVSKVGEPTATTRFNPAPDSAWPQVPGVERLSYDFQSIDQSGQAQHLVAVYLRRGRVLMGIYFQSPDGPQSAVSGQTTLPGIVNLFATKLAQLPASDVG